MLGTGNGKRAVPELQARARRRQEEESDLRRMILRYQVRRGKEAGIYLYPHRYADGSYVVSETRFECDQKKVPTMLELLPQIEHDRGVRMSNPSSACHRGPSLIRGRHIEILDN
jgi:hypothetical protein